MRYVDSMLLCGQNRLDIVYTDRENGKQIVIFDLVSLLQSLVF